MANAWGSSFGQAWGVSWGSETPPTPAKRRDGGIGNPHRNRKFPSEREKWYIAKKRRMKIIKLLLMADII